LWHEPQGSHPGCGFDDTRPFSPGRGQQSPIIQIVREHNVPMSACPFHYLRVRRSRVANRGPMPGIVASGPEHRHPSRRQVHVHHYPHAGCNGNSASSTRQAAKASASSMSSGSR
jgi:hypothetical protein